MRSKRSVWTRLRRMMRLRLVIPMVRSRHAPEHTARAVAVGLFWALTPTFGIQMGLSGIHWYISRTFFKKDFNVVVAMAWTWLTNVFTLIPAYYAFFITGQIFLGRWADLSGYQSFRRLWHTAMGGASDPTSLHAWQTYFNVIINGWELAILVGSIPFAILGYIVGYHWTLYLVKRWRRLRYERWAERAAQRSEEGEEAEEAE